LIKLQRMDSITQITLGAAVGEVVLGKKVGNRAMVWGAIAGTIPDLDILTSFFMSEINALIAHRHITHALVFPVFMAPLFGLLAYKFYKGDFDKNPIYKGLITGIGALICGLILYLLALGLYNNGRVSPLPLITGLSIVTFLAYRMRNYWKTDFSRLGTEASHRDWSWLFFWGLFTHPLLDCFTSYGTQIFQPFSDYRVSFSTVAVADPAYTVPFLICVVIASYLARGSRLRSVINWVGIGFSCLYLLWTVRNKVVITKIFENSLTRNQIQFDRTFVSPTILNNILWQAVAESDDKYYYGLYSLRDSKPEIQIDSLYKHPKRRAVLEKYKDFPTLTWFSDNYYTIDSVAPDQYKMNDLRFGVIGNLETPRDTSMYVFQFYLTVKGDNDLHIKSYRNTDRDISADLQKLRNRINGQ